tara:strand:+ start:870 stop:1118 length:249 start_codon:yes stop_codon:yes gene_type:complete
MKFQTTTINYATKLGNFSTIFTTESNPISNLHWNMAVKYSTLDGEIYNKDSETMFKQDFKSNIELLKRELISRDVKFTVRYN